MKGMRWKLVSEETKHFYFNEFKNMCLWEEVVNAPVRDAWKKKVATRYRDKICKIKKAGKKPKFME
ncbi:conserved hypothetical protein [Ricinus communis]|uniref:Uncharacterized protein n=1 Tax=Ricinus communis TaxID=3988 RepID=B9SP47_RICCO|nr:conserved hypothetical protein [Ricinus communis]